MVLSLKIGNEKHSCQVIRTSRKRSIAIEVSPYSGIVVHAPRKLNDLQIQELLEKSSRWIKRRLELLHAYPSTSRTFSTGDQFLFLGQWLALQVFPDDIEEASIHRQGSCLAAQIPQEVDRENRHVLVRAGLTEWYREQAKDILPERIDHYAPLVGVATPPIHISNARKRWGSCGIRGRLNFPWRLVMAPLSLVDYVVVHELCHLLKRDHSAAFWQLVAAVLPDYQARQRRLRMEGNFFDL